MHLLYLIGRKCKMLLTAVSKKRSDSVPSNLIAKTMLNGGYKAVASSHILLGTIANWTQLVLLISGATLLSSFQVNRTHAFVKFLTTHHLFLSKRVKFVVEQLEQNMLWEIKWFDQRDCFFQNLFYFEERRKETIRKDDIIFILNIPGVLFIYIYIGLFLIALLLRLILQLSIFLSKLYFETYT